MKVLGFSIVVFPEGKSYTAWCPDLDIASQGKNAKEAMENIKEAIELHLECLTSSELNEIKEKQGSTRVTTIKVTAPA